MTEYEPCLDALLHLKSIEVRQKGIKNPVCLLPHYQYGELLRHLDKVSYGQYMGPVFKYRGFMIISALIEKIQFLAEIEN